MGLDGCAGIDGWYVDDVTVVQCALAAPSLEVTGGDPTDSDTTGTMHLLVGDADGDAAGVTLAAASSNEALVPAGGITFGGTGPDRTVTISADPHRSGRAVVTVTATDVDGNTSSVDIKILVGNRRNNVLNGSSLSDLIFGRGGKDLIRSWDGNDLISGGDDSDFILAWDGDDTMSGGHGNDRLKGGKGADFFSGGAGFDIALDFDADEGDTTDGTIRT